VIVNQGLVDPPELPSGSQPTSWSRQRSDVRRIEIVFNEAVQAQVTDIRLINLGRNAGQDPQQEIPLTEDHFQLDGASVVLKFDHGELSDGVYAIEIASTVSDLHGNPLNNGGESQTIAGNDQNGLYRVAGDWNGDGAATIFDFPTLAYWFGRSTPTAPEYVDLNNDLGISIFDFGLFAEAFNNQVHFAAGLGPVTAPLAALPSAYDGSPKPSVPSSQDDDRLDAVQQPADVDRQRATAVRDWMFDEARRPWREIDRLDLAQRPRSRVDAGEVDQLQGSADEWLDVNV
jgi:hypothetical protein